MEVNGVGSTAFQAASGNSDKELNSMLDKRLGYYSSLQDKVDLSNAAVQLGKNVKLAEDKDQAPSVPCSLGNLNVAQKARELNESDYEKYAAAVENIGSGSQSKFLKGLNMLTGETQSALKKKLGEMNLNHAGRFASQISELTDSELSNICSAMGKLTEHKGERIFSSAQGSKIYV